MGYIFESEIEMIMNSVRARTIGEAETIRLRDILTADVHPAVKAYFKARVEQLLQKERESEARSKKFPYALPEVVRLQEQIDLLLVHYYQFGQHDFEMMLDHAVHFQFNFLCRPQWTLVNFIFESQRRRSTAEMERRLKYCVDYEYYGEIIKRYIEDRGLVEMTYEEFTSLLEKIDREIVARHSSVELALMTRPMLRFIEVAGPQPERQLTDARIPINAAIVFFEDKKLDDIKDRLEAERDRNDLKDISLLQLANVIERVRTGSETAEVMFPQDHPEMQEAPSEVDLQLAPQPAPQGSEQGGEMELAERSMNVLSGSSDLNSVFAEKRPKAEAAQQREEMPAGPQGLIDVHTLFSPAEQKLFTRRIFRKDEVSFREALDELNRISVWSQASKFIENIFVANDVDPFSEDAILFTDRIQSRYVPVDGGQAEG